MASDNADRIKLDGEFVRAVFDSPDDLAPLVLPGDASDRSLFFKSSIGIVRNILNLEVRVEGLDISDIDPFKRKVRLCLKKIVERGRPLKTWEFAIDLAKVRRMDRLFLAALISEIVELRAEGVDAFACRVTERTQVHNLMKRCGLLDGFTLSGAVGLPNDQR